MAYYTAVLFAHNWFAHHGTFTVTREVQTSDLEAIVELLTKEGKVERKHIDTVILMKNGKYSPEVMTVWSSKTGQFRTEQEKEMADLALRIDRLMTAEERRVFLNTFCSNNPHYRGAHVADILETLYDTDSHVEKTDAMYEAHKVEIDKYPRGLYSMSVFVAIYCQLGTDWEVIRDLLKRFK